MGYTGARKKNICGNKVRELRQEKGLSRDYLATQLQLRGVDISQDTLAQIENGARYVTDKELVAFVRVLGVGVEVLLSL